MSARPASYVPLSVGDGIRAWARITPDKVAVQEGGRSLTYAQLVERIDRVANGVADGLGLRSGERVAIVSLNCLEYIEILAGLSAAGVVAVPISPAASPGELSQICSDSGARAQFVHWSVEETAREAGRGTVEHTVVIGGDYEEWLQRSRPGPPAVSCEEWDPFEIIY